VDNLPWVCSGEGNNYNFYNEFCGTCGSGSFAYLNATCRRCNETSTNAGDPCRGDADCDGGTCEPDDSVCKTCDLTTTPVCDTNSDNPGTDCSLNGDMDCPNGLCIQPGLLCVDNSDCNDGACVGTCDETPACLTGACCDSLTGDCIANSTLETCNGVFQGLGSDCLYNCCEQPVDKFRDPQSDLNMDGEPDGPWSGGDDCDDAFIHQITVPAPGDPPVVVTITGDNSLATNTENNPDTCISVGGILESERGWWEAFSIDTCANVWIDRCCSDCDGDCSPMSPWIYDSCPCGKAIHSGYPLCPVCHPIYRCFLIDGNYLDRFDPLPAGTYYYPILTGVGANIGQYQLHINVEACEVAACCINNEDNTISNCSMMNQIECDEAGGYYLGPPNRFPAISECDPDLCDTGSCCFGTGDCVDLEDGMEMNIVTCNVLGGEYTGGIRCHNGICSSDPLITCDFETGNQACAPGDTCMWYSLNDVQRNPCPVCENASQSNCQQFEDVFHFKDLPSDLSMTGKLTLADDFIPLSETISSVCVWGFYLSGSSLKNSDYVEDCGYEIEMGDDQFRVRVFENTTDDLPGNFVGESMVSNFTRGKIDEFTTFIYVVDTYVYNFELDTPIDGMVLDGRTYWIEVVNDLSDFPDCYWRWWQLDEFSLEGNHYSAVGSNSFYGFNSVSTSALAFCLDIDFTLPPAPVKPCCICTDGTCENLNFTDCKNAQGAFNDPDCVATNGVSCPGGAPANDSCNTPEMIDSIPFITSTNNFCATTDGFNPIKTEFGEDALDNDIWYSYTPIGDDCHLTASMCASGVSYDSVLAIYTRGTEVCPCPTDRETHLTTFLKASDDGCTAGAVSGAGYIQIEARADVCYTIRVGGWAPGDSKGTGVFLFTCPPSGIHAPDPVLPDPDSPGGLACGGGPIYGLPCSTCPGGELCTNSVDDCGGDPCEPTDTLCGEGFTCGSNAAGLNITNPWPKNRYIGFMPNSTDKWVGHKIAIRVTLVDVPSNPSCNGEVRWAGEPAEFSESEGSLFKLQAAKLGTEPIFVDWNAIGLPIQLYGEEINPGSLYSIQALDIVSDTDLTTESNYSLGLLVKTAVWGDVTQAVGAIGGAGQPNIDDVTAVVGKWLGQLIPLRAISQLYPAVIDPANDLSINDVTMAINAWLGSPYPYGVTSCP